MKRYQITVEEIVDHQPAQPEAVTMTAAAAMEWLRGDRSRRVVDRQGDVWWYIVPRSMYTFDGDNRHLNLSTSYAPYTPLLPATRSQVVLEREITDSRAASKGLEKACDGLRQELTSALGSQKAAVAALEVERAENKRLVNKVNALALVFDKTKRAIQVYEMAPVATAGKESGNDTVPAM